MATASNADMTADKRSESVLTSGAQDGFQVKSEAFGPGQDDSAEIHGRGGGPAPAAHLGWGAGGDAGVCAGRVGSRMRRPARGITGCSTTFLAT